MGQTARIFMQHLGSFVQNNPYIAALLLKTRVDCSEHHTGWI
jgi:hypothetical protein